jgi:hypothetical protein
MWRKLKIAVQSYPWQLWHTVVGKWADFSVLPKNFRPLTRWPSMTQLWSSKVRVVRVVRVIASLFQEMRLQLSAAVCSCRRTLVFFQVPERWLHQLPANSPRLRRDKMWQTTKGVIMSNHETPRFLDLPFLSSKCFPLTTQQTIRLTWWTSGC